MVFRLKTLFVYLVTLVFVTVHGVALSAQNGAHDTKTLHTSVNKKPNVVMIVADDHGLDALGAYGNSVIKTPNIDALAKDGARFDNAFATVSSCSPSRSVILTGRQNHANGMYGLQHKQHHFSSFDQVRSLPIILSENGYRTARIGKYHLGPEQVFKFDQVLSKGAANDMQSIARSPVEMANKSVAFISESEQPFFLYFASDDPHRAFPFDTYPNPNSFGNRSKGYPGIKEVFYKPEEVVVPEYLPDTPAARKEIAEYYQAISRLDQGVGQLVKQLKAQGKYQNTLILYLSDNGIAFPGAKTNLYDAGIHLPLIVKAPGSSPSSEACVQNSKDCKAHKQMVSWVDLTPTILDYAKVPIADENMQGKSFKAVIETDQNQGWERVFASHSMHEVMMYYPMRMVRNKEYKLIWNIAHGLSYPFAADLQYSLIWQDLQRRDVKHYANRSIKDFMRRPEFELFDMRNDPQELHNLAYLPEYDKLRQQLTQEIKTFQKNTNDPWVTKWLYQ
ncbi:sulfatase family protein [Paraglaciecola arctica]|uniref:sulfatase family protein n=1 Tax=Paraglaciecola arctica TaxID=1128911 RepID=UPI001C07E075|nr:sulfatase [Paraglaciecola arctica]MBU3005324.1 sulfatase [Paraglaciecola arctica]